ncbi:putative f-box domain protein [Botryosphaeria dothidea]|uniref:F-box domain protein n=1 Tax=Botryosphaeria dothidea TaxID=55169 RepID=A0A8H4IUF4_9PEZI|nr:putative f-box domain protein [Botryosphaeria dothidea]
MHRVLGIYELVELVFLHLPMRDLLRIQQVCRAWQSTIQNSPTIQQSLFFAPKRRKHPIYPEKETWEVNALLAEEFPPWFQIGYIKSRWDWPMARSFTGLPWTKDEKKIQAFMRPEASWRRMLVTQPPIRDVQIIIKCDHIRNLINDDYLRFVGKRQLQEAAPGADSLFSELLKYPGATMGFLYDITQDFILSKHVVSNFFIQWRPFLPPDTSGYVSDSNDEDDGFVDEPDDVCGFGTPSWRRRDEEDRDMLAIHLSYTAQRDATLLPTPLPHLKSKNYTEINLYKRLLEISAGFIASEGSQEDRPTDFYETCSFLHREHGNTMLTWDSASLEGSTFAQFPWTYNAQIHYLGETWK